VHELPDSVDQSLPRKFTQVASRSAQLVLITLGVPYILLGLLVNELTIASWVGVDSLGPFSRQVIRALDLAAITWGALTILYRRHTFIANTSLSLIATILLMLSIEGILHAFPGLLGSTFANGILTKYTTNPGGIYYFDPVLRMNFMLPSYNTEMTYNGYSWHHQTDEYGFRNHESRTKADIILLGDSNVYGHGLNIEQTVGYFLERLIGRPVYNLARQGDSSLQQAYLLSEQISRLQPRVVLYFFCENDIRDLYAYRTDNQLQEFIETPVNDITYPPRMNVPSAIKERDEQNVLHRSSLLNIIRQWSYVARVYNWNQFIRKDQAFEARISDQNHDVNNARSIGWRYTRKAIAYMNYVAAQHGTRFIIVPIPAFNKRLIAILKDVAAEQALPFVDTTSLDHSDPSDAALFLPGDGHLSEEGSRAIALLSSEQLAKNTILSSPKTSH
jgi:hypothetical protein